MSPPSRAPCWASPRTRCARSTRGELRALVEGWPAGPIHIHAAEQTAEVEECVAWSGARPVQWLLDTHAARTSAGA